MDNRKLLKTFLKEMNINATEIQINKLITFQEFIFENNKKLNLLGPSSLEDILIRHIIDSVSLLTFADRVLANKVNIIDIGTGGGFPGIPLSIFLNDSKIVLLDKSRKKVDFLARVIKLLSLDNVSILTGRAEEISRQNKWRGSFDIVIARAVTKINMLLEYSFPFCKVNGKIIFYKSRKVYREIELSGDAVDTLGGKIEELIKVKVSGLDEFRAFLIMKKYKYTPLKYPRNFSDIKRNPL